MAVDFVGMLRDYASRSVVWRAGVYTFLVIVSALLASIVVAFARLPQTPPIEILLTSLFMIAGFYIADPENAYTDSDIIAIFLSAVFLTVIMALAGYASQLTLIKQYAAPLVFMQNAGKGMASALQVAPNDVLGLALLNLWSWIGGLSMAMGIKQLITSKE